MVKIWFLLAALFGFLSVALGAFGAHSLKNILDEYGKFVYEKAVIYQMFHSMALFAVGVLQHLFNGIPFSPAGFGFLVGILLFSGSLYVMAISGVKWLGAITPIGGISFLFGWAWLIFAISKVR